MPALMEYLKSKYRVREPFMYDDVTSAGFSLSEAEDLVEKGELKRLFDDAYYYGDRPLDPTAYVCCKFICRNEKTIGYYSNLNLDNLMGISPQVPFVTSVTSNLIAKDERRKVGNLGFRFFKPFAPITDENVQLQKLLDVLFRRSYRNLNRDERKNFLKFVRENNLDKARAAEFINLECPEESKERLLNNLEDAKIE